MSSADFFKSFFLILSGIPSEYQTVWIQNRSDILWGLIWIQTVCKGYQQTTLVAKDCYSMLITKHLKTVWTQIRTDKISGLIFIRSEFLKSLFLKLSAADKNWAWEFDIKSCLNFILTFLFPYNFFIVWFDSLRPSQHYFSHVGTGLPGLNQF